jgi:caspase domain-containing protein
MKFRSMSFIRLIWTVGIAAVFLIVTACCFAQPQGSKGGTKTGTKAAAPAASDAVASKGFSRLAVTPEIKQQFEGDQRYAVLVAPNYAGSELNALRFTVADTLELKTELERQGYDVRLISPGEATAETVKGVLTNARQLFEGKSQSTFLFAFSGHGFLLKDGGGKDRNYLVTLGVTKDRLAEEALALDDVEKLMADSGAKRKVILIDACRNDPNAKSADAPRTFAQFQEAEGTSILLSTRPGGFSYEDKELGHGIFTYYILEALRGKAAGKDGYVTFYDLEKYVETSVVARAIKQDLMQRPFALGERSGDFLIATAAPPKPGEVATLPAAAQQIDSNSMMLREIGSARAFYALTDGGKLTLIDNKSLTPFVELTDSGAKDLAEGYRHFRGTGAHNERFDVAVQMKGEAISGVKGRVGTPCPNECTTTSAVPLLPGEKMQAAPVRDGADRARRGLGALTSGLPGLGGKGAKSSQKGAAASDTTVKVADSQNDLLRFRWTGFELTSNMLKQAAR